jgi:hypothetical protein
MSRVPFGSFGERGNGKPMEEEHQVSKAVGLQNSAEVFPGTSIPVEAM